MMRRILALLFLALLSQHIVADSWPSLLRRGDSLLHAHSYEQAAAVYTQAIAAIDTSRKAAFFEALANRARCLKAMGEYSHALADYNHAIETSRDYTPLSTNRTVALLNKSDLLIATGQYDEIIDDLLPLNLKEGSKEATFRLNNLAIAYSQTRHEAMAITLLDTLIASTATTNSSSLGTLLQNRAFINWQLNERQDALSDFDHAVSLLEHSGEQTLMTCLSNRAVLLSEMGFHSKAIADIDRALNWLERQFGTSHPEYIISLRKKYEILLRAGQKKEAATVAQAYYKAEKAFVVKEFPAYNQQRRLNFWKLKKPQLSEIFAMENDGNASFLYDVALFRRSMSLLPTSIGSNIADAVGKTETYVRKYLRPGQCAVEFVCYRKMDEPKDTVYAAILCIPNRKPTFVKLFDTTTLRSFIVNGKPLCEAVFSDNYADKDSIYSSKPLAAMVWKAIAAAIPQNTKQIFFAPDGILHALAIEYLPFDALADKELFRLTTTAKLAERKTDRRTAASKLDDALLVGGLDYSQLASENTADTKPNHDAAELLLESIPQGSWFGRLRYTGEEVDRIDSLLNGATVRHTIAEEDIKTQLPSHKLVHLATHGYALMDSSQPQGEQLRDSLTEDRSLLASGIALSGANKAFGYPQRDDGILSAKELSQLKLSNVRLTVLSACQTAIGNISDEGPAGIVRGLKKGGANTIVATLWSVNDESTMLFMSQLYRCLAAGMSIHKAFANARNALRSHETRREYVRRYNAARMVNETVKLATPVIEHPFASPSFWAAYILIDAI